MKTIAATVINLFPSLQTILLKLSVYPRFLIWRKRYAVTPLIEAAPREKRQQLYRRVIDVYKLEGEAILYVEFGVHEGASIFWWANNNTNPASNFVGFDSFEGLPEEWISNRPKSFFSTDGATPQTDDIRVRFIAGWFHETLHRSLEIFQTNARKIIHLDADLYRSTIYPLLLLGPYLRSGDILMFDEFLDSINEYRAFEEFIGIFGFEYDVVAATKNYAQIAIHLRS